MIASELTARAGPVSVDSEATFGTTQANPGPMTTLRGARVEVDAKHASRVIVGICLVSLLALVVALFAAGADKNAQINELRLHGVPVEVTVSKCLGLLGGSGSNEAGYACKGTYTLFGHNYNEAIPGNIFRAPGTRLNAVAAPSDPRLFSTASDVASEHASLRVFILPAILLIVLALLVVALVVRSRSRSPGAAAKLGARR